MQSGKSKKKKSKKTKGISILAFAIFLCRFNICFKIHLFYILQYLNRYTDSQRFTKIPVSPTKRPLPDRVQSCRLHWAYLNKYYAWEVLFDIPFQQSNPFFCLIRCWFCRWILQSLIRSVNVRACMFKLNNLICSFVTTTWIWNAHSNGKEWKK